LMMLYRKNKAPLCQCAWSQIMWWLHINAFIICRIRRGRQEVVL
jgi:hypothetical protein